MVAGERLCHTATGRAAAQRLSPRTNPGVYLGCAGRASHISSGDVTTTLKGLAYPEKTSNHRRGSEAVSTTAAKLGVIDQLRHPPSAAMRSQNNEAGGTHT